MVLIVMIVSACRNKYIYYQGHFKIEKIHMTRISIEGFPAEKAALYLMEVAYSNAPHDSMIYDGKLRMPEIFPRSVDSITMVTFKNKGLLVHPNQTHWIPIEDGKQTDAHSPINSSTMKNCDENSETILCNNNDTVDASMYLREIMSNKIISVSYLADYRDLPYDLMCMMLEYDKYLFDKCLFDNAWPCSNRHLISFDGNSPLPDEAYIQLKDSKRIKIEIDNELKEFRLVRNVRYYHPRN